MADAIGSQIGSVYVRIGADTTPLDVGLSRAKGAISSFGSAAGTAATAAVAAFTAAAAGVTAAAAAVVSFTRTAADGAVEIRNLSRVANSTVEDFQRLAYAAKSVGLEQSKVSDVLKDVNDKLGEFNSTGGGPLKDFFENIAPKVNVTADAFRNLSGPQALQLYYNSLEKAGASQAQMTFYMEALASDATALVPLLRNGGDALRKLGDDAERTGIILSALDIAKLAEVRDIFQRFGAVLDGIRNQIAIAVAPLIAELSDRFSTGAINARKFGEWTLDATRGIAVGVAQVIDVFQRLNPVIQAMRVAVSGLGVVQANVAAQMVNNIGGTVDFLTSKINLLISAIDKIPGIDIDFRIPRALDADFAKAVNGAATRAGKAFDDAWRALMDSTNFDLVTPQVRQFFDDAKARADALGQSLQDLGSKGGSGLAAVSGKTDELKKKLEELRDSVAKIGMTDDQGERFDLSKMFGNDPRAGEALDLLGKLQLDRQRKLNEDRLADLESYLATETEAEIKAHQDRMTILNDLYEQDRLSEEERKLYQQDLEEKHQQALTDIKSKGEQQRANLVQKWADVETDARMAVLREAVNLLDQFAGKSKAAAIASIAISKGIAIAETIMWTQAAAARALAELGYLAGPPVAAAIEAAGAVRVGIIAATGLAQVAGAMSSGSNLRGGASNSVGGQSAPPAAAQPERQPTTTVINLTPGMYDHKAVAGLITVLNEAVGDGARIRVR